MRIHAEDLRVVTPRGLWTLLRAGPVHHLDTLHRRHGNGGRNVRHLAGGPLTGFGGALALDRTIGQGVTGVVDAGRRLADRGCRGVVVASPSSGQTCMSMFERATAIANLPAGTMRRVKIHGHDVLIANAGGAVLATDDTCTHEDASLSCGSADRRDRPMPAATAPPSTCAMARPSDEPAEEPLRCHEVKVEDGAIFVRLREE